MEWFIRKPGTVSLLDRVAVIWISAPTFRYFRRLKYLKGKGEVSKDKGKGKGWCLKDKNIFPVFQTTHQQAVDELMVSFENTVFEK